MQAAFQCGETPQKSSLHIAKERINRILRQTGIWRRLRTGVLRVGAAAGEIPTVGQNNCHEIQGIKSVFQTAWRFRAHTKRPSINVFKTIRELKWNILQNYWRPYCQLWVWTKRQGQVIYRTFGRPCSWQNEEMLKHNIIWAWCMTTDAACANKKWGRLKPVATQCFSDGL